MSNYPPKYELFNSQQSKNLMLALQVEGVSELITIGDLYTTIRYGDPGISYGLAGVVYGGLRRLENVQAIIMLDGGLSLSQKIEPEQGRASVSTITIELLDLKGFASLLVAQNGLLNEPLGNKECKLFVGYKQTSFPDDYVLAFRGYMTKTSCPAGKVVLQLSDPTFKKRQPLFETAKTKTTSALDTLVTTIPVIQTERFYDQIQGPDFSYDSSVRTFIKVDNELMEYGPGDRAPTSFTVQRGGSHSLGTAIDNHDLGAEVGGAVQLTGNVITLALKLMLSGWGGPCVTNEAVPRVTRSFPGYIESNVFILTKDAVKILGLSVGDKFYLSGSSIPGAGGNNKAGYITGFGADSGFDNLAVYTDITLTPEIGTSLVAAFRSKYDTLPTLCGLKMRMSDVDVSGMEYLRDTYFTQNSTLRLYYDAPKQGKDVIDTDMMLTVGAYSITRFGRCSLAVTRPPLPGEKLIELNESNVLEPDKITVERALNSRRFYNLITYDYDYSVAVARNTSLLQILDTTSISEQSIGTANKLPITAPGVHTDLGGAVLASNRGRALLARYKNCALELKLKVNWGTGSVIEVGDVVLVRDEGNLKIMNFATGERNIGSQVFEVIDRNYDIKNGSVSLTLLGGVGFNVNERYAGVAPSSEIVSGTPNSIRVSPSYGSTTLTQERAKWSGFIGLPVLVHDYYWTRQAQTTILNFPDSDEAAIIFGSALPFTPQAGDILEVAPYPTDTDPKTNELYKLLYAFYSPQASITSGISQTQFTVSDPSLFHTGATVIVHNADYSDFSPEVVIDSVSGNLVVVRTALGFTPTTSHVCEGLGFNDGLGFYRFV